MVNKIREPCFEGLESRTLMSGMQIMTHIGDNSDNPVYVEQGSNFSVSVSADSTEIADKAIRYSRWHFKIPSSLNGYLTLRSSNLPDTNNPSQNSEDFFFNLTMDPAYNRIDSTMNSSGELDGNERLMAVGQPGVANKDFEHGLLGTYSFSISPDAPLGTVNCTMHEIKFTDVGGVNYISTGGGNSATIKVTNKPFTVVTKVGDANLDGAVGVDDLVSMTANWNKSGGWAEGDFNGDGHVDLCDLVAMTANWGWTKTAPVAVSTNYVARAVSADSASSTPLVPEQAYTSALTSVYSQVRPVSAVGVPNGASSFKPAYSSQEASVAYSAPVDLLKHTNSANLRLAQSKARSGVYLGSIARTENAYEQARTGYSPVKNSRSVSILESVKPVLNSSALARIK